MLICIAADFAVQFELLRTARPDVYAVHVQYTEHQFSLCRKC